MRLELTLPDHLDLSETEVKWQLAARLFDKGLLTSGQAAELIGVSKHEFIMGVGKYEVSVFQVDTDRLLGVTAD